MEKIKQSLRESATARWIALILVSLTMFFTYFLFDNKLEFCESSDTINYKF
jgi:hypothetical protein